MQIKIANVSQTNQQTETKNGDKKGNQHTI